MIASPGTVRVVVATVFAAWLPSLAPATESLDVFAAASLGEAFTEIARTFGERHPSVAARLHFAGSQQLVAQIEQGAAADVFAAADEPSMERLQTHGRIAGNARIFARNRLVVVVHRGSSHARDLADLAAPGTKVVLAGAAVPAGRYARAALARMSETGAPSGGATPGADFAARVLGNVVSEEESVKGVLAKVQLGEADAGIVYRSDVTAAVERSVRTLAIPEAADVLARYPIAVVEGARNPRGARAFIDLVLSAEGQAILARHGFHRAAEPQPGGGE